PSAPRDGARAGCQLLQLGAGADRLGEGGPVSGGEDQLGAVGVLGIAYRDGGGHRAGHLDAVAAVARAVGGLAPHLGNLDAVTAVASAVARFAPYGAGQVHVLATSFRSSSEAARGSASAFNVSYRSVTALTSSGRSTTSPVSAVSRYTI